ncbi:TetR family transcriptional regulator [Microbispora bryophytorum]|uniref:TetR/AcrR family transcriptional regulator n=1 Tax=Microbispora bryophytorum TaxID=1460882 RepID=UPI0036AF7307
MRDPEARRAAILTAAHSVFAERGYAKATIREIAQRAGVTHGLVVLLTGPDVALRVDLLGAHLIGVTFSRYVLADGPIAAMSAGELTRYLTMTLDGILFGSAGTAPASS